MSFDRDTSTRIVGLLFAAVFVVLPTVADAEIVGRIVARVNDEIITDYELDEAVTPYLLQNGTPPSALDDPKRRAEIRRKVLEEKIERQLILEEADEMGLEVTDEQVDRWMKMTRERQNMSEQQFRQLVGRYDMDFSDYREMVRKNLLKMRLVKVKLGRQVSVSDEEVNRVYREKYGSMSGRETKLRVRHILIRPEGGGEEAQKAARRRAEKILSKLETSDASFEQLAKEHSDGPSAQKGGLLGTFGRGDLNPTLDEVAFELEAGEHSGVVQSKYGFHIVRVDERKTAESPDVQKRKKQIRQRLKQKKLQEQVEVYTEKLREQAFVDIKID